MNNILNTLVSAGYESYLAGGVVRDILMGNNPKDIDIATSATPDEIKNLFEHTVCVGEKFGTVIVIDGEDKCEVTTFRNDMSQGRHPRVVFGASAREDAERRDFTINSIFMDINGNIIDYFNGVGDIQRKLICATGDAHKRFLEDPLRILRAVRFASRLGFDIEENTGVSIIRNSHLITELSKERIRDEICKGMSSSYFTLLRIYGLLDYTIPELFSLINCMQGQEHHPEGDVWNHTMLMIDSCDNNELAWACLLHDIGKPITKKVLKDKITFHGHAEVGAGIAKDILTRLRFGNKFIDKVSTVVKNHMDFMNVKEMKMSTFKNMVFRPTHNLEMMLHERDAMASNGNLNLYDYITEKKKSIPKLKPLPIITGRHLISIGMKPGVEFKKILNEVYSLQLNGIILTEEDGLNYIKNL